MSIAAVAYVLELPAERCRMGARLAAIAIANFANDRGEAWPSISTIARLAGLNTQTARRAVVELCEADILERIVGGSPDGRIPANKRPNLYRFLEFPASDETEIQGSRKATTPPIQGHRITPLDPSDNAYQGSRKATTKPLVNRKEPRRSSSLAPSNRVGVTEQDVLNRLEAAGNVPDFGPDPDPNGAKSLAEIRAALK